MARKPKTNQQKLLVGETRPSRTATNVIEFPKIPDIPEPPKHLPLEGKRLWNEIAPQLFNLKILTYADIPALTHMCQLHGEIISNYKRKVPTPVSSLNQLRMYFSEFGMTPSSRTRVGAPSGGGDGSKFGANKRPQK